MPKRNAVSSYLTQILLVALALFLFAFPLLFTTATTENFVLPKQALATGASLLILITMGLRMLSDGRVIVRRTPLDLAILLFTLVVFTSTLFALNRADALISFAPFLFAILFYFLIVNVVRSEKSILLAAVSLVASATVVALLAVLTVLRVPLPFAPARLQTFSPLGGLLDQVMFLALVLPVAVFFFVTSPPHLFLRSIKELRAITRKKALFGLAAFSIGIGLAVSVYALLAIQKPPFLPFATGLQTAFAAISQDTARFIQALLFGSGFGTFTTVFTRFKHASFNLNQQLWSFTFFRSSSFLLELLATTGVLGVISFFLLLAKIARTIVPKGKRLRSLIRKEGLFSTNPFVLPLLLLLLGVFLLPFSFNLQAIFFVILGLFSAAQGIASLALTKQHGFYDVELCVVALRKGLIALSSKEEGEVKKDHSLVKLLPVFLSLILLVFCAVASFFAIRFVASDVLFARSLEAAAKNNGLQTYNNQVNAIQLFPYRDGYFRIYSQTNLALANSLSSTIRQEASPSAQTQSTIYTLIQQSISAARRATAISPHTSLNWQNLSSIYRGLIGLGQNAESFAIVAAQQAVALDPNNPQAYIYLGGIYFQLGQWDNAQRQFQIAVTLKPDLANAYYNLGHALEAKGDLAAALTQYQTVKSLVLNDRENLKKVSEEIDQLERLIGKTAGATPSAKLTPSGTQPPLSISSPSAQLPQLQKKLQLPPPATATGSGF